MAHSLSTLVRAPGAETPVQFTRRVRNLARLYVALFVLSVVGTALLVWRVKLLVALAQRSNVETMTLLFFLLFFGYVAVLSAPGARGALRLRANRRGKNLPPRARTRLARAAVNLVIERSGAPGMPVRLAVEDADGAEGYVEMDGARLEHVSADGAGSCGLLAFVVQQVREVMAEQGAARDLAIVAWATLDSELAARFLGLVGFARNLEQHLHAPALWPKVVLDEGALAQLRERLSAVCGAVREEAHLPDWEYAVELKIPVVPEPLGLVSLSRAEPRADPLAAMGCATLVVGASVLLLAVLVFFPPWVPGS